MRIVHMNREGDDVKKGGPVRLTANNISYRGEPLSQFLDKVVIPIDDDVEIVDQEDPSVFSDTSVDVDRGWSSKKISEELAKLNNRISGIISFGDENEHSPKEILDARIDYNGKTHFTLGESIRDQITEIHDRIDKDVLDIVRYGSNEYSPNLTSVSNKAILYEMVTVSGDDSNEILIDHKPGYYMMTAVNCDFDKCNFFVAGVANDKEHGRIFCNRIIKSSEHPTICIQYIKMVV